MGDTVDVLVGILLDQCISADGGPQSKFSCVCWRILCLLSEKDAFGLTENRVLLRDLGMRVQMKFLWSPFLAHITQTIPEPTRFLKKENSENAPVQLNGEAA